MGSTELRKRGADISKLPDKQRRFCLEYLQDYNGTQAAIRAGYSRKTASVLANKILKKPAVKRFLGKFERESQEQFELERNEILRHLAACATRDGKMFVNDRGVLHGNLNDLPDEVTAAIDSIKQKVRTYTTQDGEEVTEVETELKLVSKAAALDMAMKHKGLFAAEKHDHSHQISINWDEIQADARRQSVIDVESLALEEQ